MAEKKYGCIIYEDVFDRLDSTFTDEELGRILRAAYTYGFHGVIPDLQSPIEKYACAELQSLFDRNKEGYDKQTRDGQIAAAKRYAKTEDDLKDRLEDIEGLTNYEKMELVRDWRSKHSG